MALSAPRPLPTPPPAARREILGRLILALAFIAVAYGLMAPPWMVGDANSGPELAIIPRLGAFLLTAFVAGLIQGARTRNLLLFVGAVAASVAALLLLPDPVATNLKLHGKPWTGSAQDLGLLQASLLAAALWGTLFARGLTKPSHLLMVVLCASAGDAWLNLMRVPDTVSAGHPLKLLRLAWPPAVAQASYAPTFTDLMFLSLYLEAGRRFRFHGPSILFGAVAGYAVATLLSLVTLRVMLALPLVSLGVLMGAWPDFRCTGREVLGAFVAAVMLFVVLLGLHHLRLSLHPQPTPRPEPRNINRVAEAPLARPRATKKPVGSPPALSVEWCPPLTA